MFVVFYIFFVVVVVFFVFSCLLVFLSSCLLVFLSSCSCRSSSSSCSSSQGMLVGVVVRTAVRALCCGTLLVLYTLWLKKYEDGDGIVWPAGLEHHKTFDTVSPWAGWLHQVPP